MPLSAPDWNPLYDLCRKCHPRGRQPYWSAPLATPEAIQAIVTAAPRLVELGAGTGYWAQLLASAGADVVALDNVAPGTRNTYGGIRSRDEEPGGQVVGRWFPVEEGDAQRLAAYPDRALFLCWPPMDSMAADALAVWRGDVLILIGERGGCTGTDAFYERLDAEFDTVAEVRLPQWDGIHDDLEVCRRKGSAS